MGRAVGVNGMELVERHPRSPSTRRDRPRLQVAGQIVCCLGMSVAGVLVVVTQESVLQRIGGCVLVVSAICGAVAVFYQTRPPTSPTTTTTTGDTTPAEGPHTTGRRNEQTPP